MTEDASQPDSAEHARPAPAEVKHSGWLTGLEAAAATLTIIGEAPRASETMQNVAEKLLPKPGGKHAAKPAGSDAPTSNESG